MTIIDNTRQTDESLEVCRRRKILESIRERLPQIIDDLKCGIELERRMMGAARASRVRLFDGSRMEERDFADVAKLLTQAVRQAGLMRSDDSLYLVYVDRFGSESPGTKYPHGTVATLRFNPPLV